MSENYFIGIDTGNRCIKTAHHVFVSGVESSDREMPFQQGVLTYNGRYYMLSHSRVSYLQDKTESDEYFVLTLYAIVQELQARGADMSKSISVSLGVGLPPSHLARLRVKFQEYFNRGIVNFTYDKKTYTIEICSVNVFSQGYAAIYKDFEQICKFSKAYVVDIGGFTTDVISLANGQIDPSFCESIDLGLIQLYNKISWQIHSKYGFAPTEEQIDEMLASGKEISPDVPVLGIIDSLVSTYINDMFRKLTEYGLNFKFAKGVFVGGGSSRFKKWIEASSYVSSPYFIDNIHANAQGYEAFLYALNPDSR